MEISDLHKMLLRKKFFFPIARLLLIIHFWADSDQVVDFESGHGMFRDGTKKKKKTAPDALKR